MGGTQSWGTLGLLLSGIRPSTGTDFEQYIRQNKSRLVEAEDQISDLKGKLVYNIQSEQQKEKKLQNEDCLRGLGDNMKYNTICTIGTQEEKKPARD